MEENIAIFIFASLGVWLSFGFLCPDGILLGSNVRCDGEIDCKDGADEQGCNSTENQQTKPEEERDNRPTISDQIELLMAEANESYVRRPPAVIEKLIDGNYSTKLEDCYRSNANANGSVRVHLNYTFVKAVAILNTDDPSLVSKFIIGTVINFCRSSGSCYFCGIARYTEKGQWATVNCESETPSANEVLLLNPKMPLLLCEVEVFGEKDECAAEGNLCSDQAVCVNENSSNKCVCLDGFDGNGYFCSDIDECAKNISDCDDKSEVCKNTEGSFECKCQSGFDYDDVKGTCVDNNECFCDNGETRCENYPCGEFEVCKNTLGSFRCDSATNSTSVGTLSVIGIQTATVHGTYSSPPGSKRTDMYNNDYKVNRAKCYECTMDPPGGNVRFELEEKAEVVRIDLLNADDSSFPTFALFGAELKVCDDGLSTCQHFGNVTDAGKGEWTSVKAGDPSNPPAGDIIELKIDPMEWILCEIKILGHELP